MTRYVLMILAPLLLGLGGCETLVASAITDVTTLHERARAYAGDIYGLRRFIRQECRASLVREIEALKREGNESALRELLASQYPDLVTVGIFKSSEGILAQAPGCE